ncbi:MAG: polynucleotide adenylyltransferase PcnB [Deltaproteobacteria bacterium]
MNDRDHESLHTEGKSPGGEPKRTDPTEGSSQHEASRAQDGPEQGGTPARRSSRPRAPRKRSGAGAVSAPEAAASLVEGAEVAAEEPRERPSDRPEAREADARFPRGPRPAVYRRAFPAEHFDDDAVKVVKRLVRNGFHAYLVGGCVRDLLLGKKPKDFDVATNARPHDIKAIFRNCRVIGRRFRLAHILFGAGKVIETATFRRDPSAAELELEIDAAEEPLVPRVKSREDDADLLIRHDNVFGEPHEDALRRDFRLNGLFYDVERQEVIDFVGGMKDVEARVLSTIGLPDVRFREDPVRILRAIKFSARLDIGIDPECLDAMIAQREELRKAAKARLFEEVLRLLRGGASHRSMWLMWESGVLAVLVPQVSTMLDDDAALPRERSAPWFWRRLDAIDAVVAEGRVPSDTVLLSAFLAGAIEEALDGARDALDAYEELMAGVSELLSLPRRIKERMRVVIGCQRRLRSGKVGTLPQREFWRDALDLSEIECRTRGIEPTLLSIEPAATPGHVPSHAGTAAGPSDAESERRRRRRKRR